MHRREAHWYSRMKPASGAFSMGETGSNVNLIKYCQFVIVNNASFLVCVRKLLKPRRFVLFVGTNCGLIVFKEPGFTVEFVS